MRNLIYLLLFIIITPLTSCKEGNDPYEKVIIETSDGKQHEFKMLLADEKDEWKKGLMFVKAMPENEGMLFYYHEDLNLSFWMKNTLIPLDIIFIRKDGVISNVHHMAVPLDEDTSLKSLGAVHAAIEINGGIAAKLGIKSGDIVKHGFFQK